MSNFDIGNVYSVTETNDDKIYYIAIKKQTLITYRNGRFGQYTIKKKKHILENSISVARLCKLWKIKTAELDNYMSDHFSPDEEALARARKEKE
jgi:hypothetical protein